MKRLIGEWLTVSLRLYPNSTGYSLLKQRRQVGSRIPGRYTGGASVHRDQAVCTTQYMRRGSWPRQVTLARYDRPHGLIYYCPRCLRYYTSRVPTIFVALTTNHTKNRLRPLPAHGKAYSPLIMHLFLNSDSPPARDTELCRAPFLFSLPHSTKPPRTELLVEQALIITPPQRSLKRFILATCCNLI